MNYPNMETSNHGVPEALYLWDPANNGTATVALELYHDKPREPWPTLSNGSLMMYTRPLDLDDLLKEADQLASHA